METTHTPAPAGPESGARSYLQITVHQMPVDLWATFARVFPVSENGRLAWVKFSADGVDVTLFRSYDPTAPTESGGEGS